MKNIWAICKKEIKTYFSSPIAYVVIAVFLVLIGFFFQSSIRMFSEQAIQMSRNPQYFQQVNINQMVYSPLFHNMSIVLLFMIPLLTMRLFSEEKKTKTDELLYTSPLSINQIILGKYFASVFILLCMLLLTGILSIFTFAYGNPEIAPILTGYLGLFLADPDRIGDHCIIVALIAHVEIDLLTVTFRLIPVIQNRGFSDLAQPVVESVVFLPRQVIEAKVKLHSQDILVGLGFNIGIQLFLVHPVLLYLQLILIQQEFILTHILGRLTGGDKQDQQPGENNNK